jgi:hypothetical protein
MSEIVAAEKVWFDITDRFYLTLRKRGAVVALRAAERAFEAFVQTPGASRDQSPDSGPRLSLGGQSGQQESTQ